MKVFALICAAAIAISTPIVDATVVAPTCDAGTTKCSGTDITKDTPVTVTPDSCTAPQVPYITAIKFDGTATADKVSYKTTNTAGDVMDTDCFTAADKATAGEQNIDVKAKECGKSGGTATSVVFTCKDAVDDCAGAYSVSYTCAAPAAGADVAVACDKPACTKADISIPDGKKAIYAAPACDPVTNKGYLKQIAITGATGDKYTFETKSAGTALEEATCKLATGAKDVTGGTADAPLTCGKGLDTAITVEVTCARGDGTACVPSANTVTFECAAAAAADTPAPSTGSMLTKANAIVGVISGMVGAIVYFNRG